MYKTLIFLFLTLNVIGQTQPKDTIDPFTLLDQAMDDKNWDELARLQKKCYLIDKNPSHLYWVARCYAWLNDTNSVYNAMDTAIISGYTNIYLIDKDTAFNKFRNEKKWQELKSLAGERYLAKERVFYWGFYYGILVLILIFNLYLFISNRELSYLFLSIIILADLHFEIYENSSLKIYITKLFPWIADMIVNRFPPAYVFVGLIFGGYLFFIKSYLKLKTRLPKFNHVVTALFVLICMIELDIVCKLKLIPELGIQIIVSATFVSGLVGGVWLLIKKVREARYFVGAVALLLLGLFFNGSTDLFIFSSLNVGILLFFTTLTIGVGSRLKIMQKEKEQAQEKALEVLEEKVQERTKEVTQQKSIIEEKQHEILDSIKYAQRLQQAILPPQDLINKHVPHNFVLYKPKDIVAGDFYWAEQIDHLFFIAAADSTGHGVPGALVSVVCSNALNRTVNEFGFTDTGKILDKTRDLVIETFAKNNAEVKDGMDISLLCIDRKNKKITWSGANNPLWYIEGAAMKEITANKQPIGKTDSPTPFTANQIDFKNDTTFYLFTDGLADQFGGPKGKKFKYKQFEELLISISNRSMQEQSQIIAQKFEDWKGVLEQVDDVCVIGIKI